MNKRFMALGLLVIALGATSAQAASPDPSKDCDTWNRQAGSAPPPSGQPSYMANSGSDVSDLKDVTAGQVHQPLPVLIHPEAYNLVVRNAKTTTDPSKVSYAEVAGGAAYTGDGHFGGKGGEGGFEQGRIYDGTQGANTGSKVTFNEATVGPYHNGGFYATGVRLCVSASTSVTGNVREDSGEIILVPKPL